MKYILYLLSQKKNYLNNLTLDNEKYYNLKLIFNSLNFIFFYFLK